jgi:Arabinose-binding domain of AraC transcription regulator, N-term
MNFVGSYLAIDDDFVIERHWHWVTAKRVELKRGAEATGFHEAYFKGPITFGARRNALVLHATDLDRP